MVEQSSFLSRIEVYKIAINYNFWLKMIYFSVLGNDLCHDYKIGAMAWQKKIFEIMQNLKIYQSFYKESNQGTADMIT